VVPLPPGRIGNRNRVRPAAPRFVPLGSKAKNSAAQRRPVTAGHRLGPRAQNCHRIPAALRSPAPLHSAPPPALAAGTPKAMNALHTSRDPEENRVWPGSFSLASRDSFRDT
jgi:hypothetical protein